jgi:hypothetical protein
VRALILTFLLYLTLGAAPALGHVAFTVGNGFGYDLAEGSTGRGHVAFLANEEPADRVHYCRIASGAAGGCDGASKILDFPGPTAGAVAVGHEAQVFALGSRVIIIASCSSCGSGGGDHTYRWASASNGTTMGAPTEIGNLVLNGQGFYIGTGDIALGVGGALFQAMDPAPRETTQVDLSGGAPFVSSPTVAPAGGKAVYAVNNLDAVKYSVFNDPSPGATTATEYNTIGNWQTGKLLPGAEPGNSETHLSSGPTGVFLSYRNVGAGANHVALRRFDLATDNFAAPAYIEGTNPIDVNTLEYPYHSQDTAGRLHVVWRSGYDGGRLRYTISHDGVNFAATATIDSIEGEAYLGPIVEAGPTSAGHVVWQNADGTIRGKVVHAGPEVVNDAVPPTISGFAMSDRTLTRGQGATFSFTSSEAGTAVLTIEKKVPGLKLKKKGKKKLSCLPKTKSRLRKLRKSLARTSSGRKLAKKVKRRRCKAFKRIGTIRQPVSDGRNQIVFSGRIAGRKLSRGTYRARLVVTDNAGNASRPRTITFRVR